MTSHNCRKRAAIAAATTGTTIPEVPTRELTQQNRMSSVRKNVAHSVKKKGERGEGAEVMSVSECAHENDKSSEQVQTKFVQSSQNLGNKGNLGLEVINSASSATCSSSPSKSPK